MFAVRVAERDAKVEVAAVAYYRNNLFLFHQCQISNNSPLYFPPQPNLIQTVLL